MLFRSTFGLFAVGTAYLENNDTENGLRLLNELNQIDDSSPVTFMDKDIADLKREINNLVKSTYKKLFLINNLSICQQMKDYGLILSEEIEEIERESEEEKKQLNFF